MDLPWEELETYLRVLGVTAERLRESTYGSETEAIHTQEEVVRRVLPQLESEILNAYERIGKVLKSQKPEVALEELVRKGERTEARLFAVRKKQEELISLGVSLIRDCAKYRSSLVSQKSEELNARDPAYLLHLSVQVLALRRKCIEQSLRRDLYSPTSLPVLKRIRAELEERMETAKDKIAVLREKLERFTQNARLRQCYEEYQRVQLQIQQKKRDIEKLDN